MKRTLNQQRKKKEKKTLSENALREKKKNAKGNDSVQRADVVETCAGM